MHECEEVVDPPLLRDEVVVERVPIKRVVDGPISVRSEGDTMIVPVLEEVLVVETRLLVTEELRITTRRTETHRPVPVTVRREDVTVERGHKEPNELHSHGQEESHGKDRDSDSLMTVVQRSTSSRRWRTTAFGARTSAP